MRNKSKVRLRIGAMCLIVLLIIIPFISIPVNAAVAFNAGSGTSTNTNPPAACTVVFAMTLPNPTKVGPGSTSPLTVTFSYTFQDLNAGFGGSNHICTMTVTEPTSGTNVVVSTGWTYVAPGATTSGTLSTGPINFANPPPNLTFSISVFMRVNDANPGGRFAQGTGFAGITVT